MNSVRLGGDKSHNRGEGEDDFGEGEHDEYVRPLEVLKDWFSIKPSFIALGPEEHPACRAFACVEVEVPYARSR